MTTKLRLLRLIFTAVIVALPSLTMAQALKSSENAGEFGFHQKFAEVLSTHVNSAGQVTYAKLKANPQNLNDYLTSLTQLKKSDFDKMNSDEKLSFWINAYNAYTLKLIIENYPIKSSFLKSALWPKNSIKQIDKAWSKKFINILGKKISLDDVEHEIIRKQFSEPRIHMALVCAAKSCPNLRNEPFIGSSLEAQLASQSQNFVNDPGKVKINKTSNTIEVSSIFKWYGKDFLKHGFDANNKFKALGFSKEEQAVLSFAEKNMTPDNQKALLQHAKNYSFLDYDWSLNEQ